MTRIDIEKLNTNDKLAVLTDAREEAHELRKPVRLAYRNIDQQRRFLDVEIVTIAHPDGHSHPLYLAVRRAGEMARLIRLGDILSIEVLK